MRHLLLFLLVVTALSPLRAGGIEFFEGTWQEALAKAEQEKKLVFVDAYATWCGPCKRMAKDVFTVDAVGDFFNENFINLKLDMEKTDGLTFGKEYPVSAYPTLFFLSGDGTVVKKIKGGQQVATLLEHGRSAVKSYDRSGDYEEKYLAGNRDYVLVYEYVEALVQAGKPHQKIANDYLRSDPAISVAERAAFVYVAATETDSKVFEEMLASKSVVLDQVSVTDWDDKLRKACLAAVDKAIEYEYPDLLEDAIDIASTHMQEGGDLFEYEARMKYALIMHDHELYVSNAKRYLKKSKYNGAELKRVIKDVHNELGGDADAVKLAAECVKKSLKYGDPELKDVLLYCKILAMADKRKDAIKLVDKAIENTDDKNRQMKQQLNQVKERLETIEPVK